MNSIEIERAADDLALARYAVISPLVCRQMTPAERQEVRAEILASIHVFPGDAGKPISSRCLERWCNWYRHGRPNKHGERITAPGIEALRPLTRLDKGKARVLEESLIGRAVALRREEPSRTTSTLVSLLQAEAAEAGREVPKIEEATLAYHLRQRRVTKRDLKRESRAFPRYEQPRRNATWQGDWTQGIALPDPAEPGKTRICHLHAFLDDHTRYVVHAEFYFRQNLPCLEDCFRKAIVHGGVPEKVYWDNGAVYHSRQVQLIAARLGTQVIFATPYCPEGKGKIERWFRTVKDAFYPEAKRAGITSLQELNEFFWGWLEQSYQTRVHSETEESPLTRWENGLAGTRYPDPASLVDLFLWEQTRRVDKSGCIQLSGNAYPVAEHLVGREVVVRFDPFDLSRVRLYENGRFAQLLEPQTLTNRTFRKALKKRKEPDSTLKSSATLRDQVRKQFRERAGRVVSQVRGAQDPCLDNAGFLLQLQLGLANRLLTETEIKWAGDFFARNAPLTERQVDEALSRAVEAKGSARHIRYYLDAVQSHRLEERAAQ